MARFDLPGTVLGKGSGQCNVTVVFGWQNRKVSIGGDTLRTPTSLSLSQWALLRWVSDRFPYILLSGCSTNRNIGPLQVAELHTFDAA